MGRPAACGTSVKSRVSTTAAEDSSAPCDGGAATLVLQTSTSFFGPGFRLCVGASSAVRSRSIVGTLEALHGGSFRRVSRRRIEHMGRRLYVGYLSYNTTELELREVFGTMGTVAEAKVVTERETGRPRGFAFVEMSTEQEAKAAVEQLSGRELG